MAATLLSKTQISAFEAILGRAMPEDRARLHEVSGQVAAAAAEAAPHWDFELPGKRAEAVLSAAFGARLTDDVRRAQVAKWALELPVRVPPLLLPQSVMDGYPIWIDRIAKYLTDTPGAYDPDYWAKDVRMTLGLSTPGSRTQLIDLTSPLGPRQVVMHGLSGRGFNSLSAYMAAGGPGKTWLETHTESRDLVDFNEAGWDNLWAAAADILKTRPNLAGCIGSSWFYDPPLSQISPKLAYLIERPTRNGAFMIHQGPGEIHTQRASMSPTRKALIDEGKYTARSWIVAWPRKPLIAWAEKYRAGQA